MNKKVNIFTDGSTLGNQFKDNVGGWAFFDIDNNKQMIGCEKNTTNNRMEMSAIINALKYIKKSNINDVVINSDSQFIINSINKKWYQNWKNNNWKKSNKKPVKNQDLWEELIPLFENKNNIKFNYIKGHSTNKWNNIVDELAVNAAKKCRK